MKDNIRHDFKFPPLDAANREIAQQITTTPYSVSVHVRRGDYLGHPLYDNICTLDYYRRAIEYIIQRYGVCKIFLFSDDINWSRDNFRYDGITFISGNEKENSYKDMHLMSLCKCNILANSSFSWWAGWLNSNPEKIVIVPKKFFNGNKYDESDLYPDAWIKL